LGYFSLAFHAQIGYRYVLMLVPITYLIAAAGLASVPPRPRWKALGALVVLSAVAENVPYLGNPLAFTNSAVQPKRDAYRLLADSNIDWGQNRERLPGWLAEREWNAARVDPVHVLPGRNVIGLNALAGVFDFEQYRWVREHLEPGGHLGHTYLWYLVDDETFNRFLYDSRRLVPDALASAVCPDSLEYALQPNGTEVPFTLRRMPRPNETSVACVVARRDTDVGFRVTSGAAHVGVLMARGARHARTLRRGPALSPHLASLPAGGILADPRLERARRVAPAHSGTDTSTSGSDQPSKLVPASSTRRLIPSRETPPRSNPSAAPCGSSRSRSTSWRTCASSSRASSTQPCPGTRPATRNRVGNALSRRKGRTTPATGSARSNVISKNSSPRRKRGTRQDVARSPSAAGAGSPTLVRYRHPGSRRRRPRGNGAAACAGAARSR